MNHILLWILFTCSLFQILKFVSFLPVVAFCLCGGETRTHAHTHEGEVPLGQRARPPSSPAQADGRQPAGPSRQPRVSAVAGPPPCHAFRARAVVWFQPRALCSPSAAGPFLPTRAWPKGSAAASRAAAVREAERARTDSSMARAPKLQSAGASNPAAAPALSEETPSSTSCSLPRKTSPHRCHARAGPTSDACSSCSHNPADKASGFFLPFFTWAFHVTLTKTSCNIALKVTFRLLHQAM